MAITERPVIHGYDHLPDGPDPIPVDLLFQNRSTGIRYIIGDMLDPADLHTFDNGGPTIDGNAGDTIQFDHWLTNDDGSVFANDGAGNLDLGATYGNIELLRPGLYGSFAALRWTANGTTNGAFGVDCRISAGAVLDGSASGFLQRVFWDNYAITAPYDPTGVDDYDVRDHSVSYVSTSNSGTQAAAALRGQIVSGGTGINTFYTPQLAVFWIGHIV